MGPAVRLVVTPIDAGFAAEPTPSLVADEDLGELVAPEPDRLVVPP